MGPSFNGRTAEWHSANRGSIPLGSTRKKVMSVKSKARKLAIPLAKIDRVVLPYSGDADAREWHRLLGEFLQKHKSEQRISVEIELSGYDGYVENVQAATIVHKTDKELAVEVKSKEDLLAAQEKKVRDKELAELERLQTKYGKK